MKWNETISKYGKSEVNRKPNMNAKPLNFYQKIKTKKDIKQYMHVVRINQKLKQMPNTKFTHIDDLHRTFSLTSFKYYYNDMCLAKWNEMKFKRLLPEMETFKY